MIDQTTFIKCQLAVLFDNLIPPFAMSVASVKLFSEKLRNQVEVHVVWVDNVPGYPATM